MPSNRQLGAAGEAAVASAFLRAGADIYTPAVDCGADLVVDVRGRLYRVQVKTSSSSANSIRFLLKHRRTGRGPDTHGWTTYESGAVDWFALFSTHHNSVVLIPGDTEASSATVTYPPAVPTQGRNAYSSTQYDLAAVMARV